MLKPSPRLVPIWQALLVTFLWSTSFIIIKWGLSEIPPLTFAGLRYAIAFLVLVPWAFAPKYRQALRDLTPRQWIKLAWLGILFYSLTQGTMFIGLSLLPSVTVSLMLNFSPIVVALMGMLFIHEFPTRIQWWGTALFMAGILFYFYPVKLASAERLGLMVMTVGVLVNAGSGVLGRNINHTEDIPPLIVTVISMGIGAAILLVTGLAKDGLPQISLTNGLLLLWMAVVNTALAFTIWNVTLRSLTAMQSSIINGTMLIQIAVLAWIFLGESISVKNGFGMTLAAAGAILVQIKFRRKAKSPPVPE